LTFLYGLNKFNAIPHRQKAMHEKESTRHHHFEFPANSGSLSIKLADGSLVDVDDDELYEVGKLTSELLYGLFIESKEVRGNYLNIFQSILKDSALTLIDKDIQTLVRYSNRAFQGGDYDTSLFLSKIVLARINKIIDNKLANNDRLIDKEVIHLQISTLNFIGYLFSKLKRNIDYGIKLTTIANKLLDEFDENSDETLQLRCAILDTLGSLHIQKKEWDRAIQYLTAAHEHDCLLISRGKPDEIGFRLTCSNLGFAIVQKCSELIDGSHEALNFRQIEDHLNQAKNLFIIMGMDKPPPVRENQLEELELAAAIKRMKKGLSILEEVKKKLQKGHS